MHNTEYLMESDEETLRLDLKTDGTTLEKQALWAGIKPGMRVADLGYGSGKTTFYLQKLVQPNGEVVGIDNSEERIEYAKKHCHKNGIKYVQRDICEPLEDMEMFDFIWVRFVLEYYRSESLDIVKNTSRIISPESLVGQLWFKDAWNLIVGICLFLFSARHIAIIAVITNYLLNSGTLIPCRSLLLRKILSGKTGLLYPKSSIFSRFGAKARLDNTIFIWYSNLDCLKPVGTCCHISGSTICCYSSPAVTQH